MLTFVCGGVRSGKSRKGEDIAETKQTSNSRLIYVATSLRTDEEMNRRIQLHRKERKSKKANWITVEQPRNISKISGGLTSVDIVFIDCLTTWLSNEMFFDSSVNPSPSSIKKYMKEAIAEIEVACAQVIIISNDIFHEPVPENDRTYTYMKTLGELHQEFVRKAKTVIEMEAGEPVECLAPRGHD